MPKRLLAAALFAASAFAQIVPVTDKMLENPDPADWLMWRRTLNSWGYSPLNQINKSNVGTLRMVWTRGMTAGIQEATPLVHSGVMYLPNPANVLQALNAATGDLAWEYKRPVPDDIARWFAGAPLKNRNIAIYDDKIIALGADDFVYGVNAADGKLAWETRVQDYRELSAQQTSGPIVAHGKVFSGRACEFKVPGEACVVTAHDAKTGKELWRVHTIPKPGEPGDETWGGIPYDQRKHVGTWMPPSYDPRELSLLIYRYVRLNLARPEIQPTRRQRQKVSLSQLHLGDRRQHRQDRLVLPAHRRSLGSRPIPFERILVDTAVAPDPSEVAWINPKLKPGERRKVLTGIPGKTGIVYTLDRQTGEFLWARPTSFQNGDHQNRRCHRRSNRESGDHLHPRQRRTLGLPRPKRRQELPRRCLQPTQQRALHARAKSLRDHVSDLRQNRRQQCLRPKRPPANGPRSRQSGHRVRRLRGNRQNSMEIRQPCRRTASLAATGGGLIFGGDANGRFRASDQDTGKVLWEINLGPAPVTGYPVIAYAANGKQYVAVSNRNVPGIGRSKPHLAPELKPGTNNSIFVFALP